MTRITLSLSLSLSVSLSVSVSLTHLIFSNFANKLGIEHVVDDEPNLPNIDYLILKAIAKDDTRPSILRIKNYMGKILTGHKFTNLLKSVFP